MKPSTRIHELESKWENNAMTAGNRAYAYTMAILEYLDEHHAQGGADAGEDDGNGMENPRAVAYGLVGDWLEKWGPGLQNEWRYDLVSRIAAALRNAGSLPALSKTETTGPDDGDAKARVGELE